MSRSSIRPAPARPALAIAALFGLHAALLIGILLATPRSAGACNGTSIPANVCAKTVALVKAMPFTVAVPPGPAVIPVPVTLITTCIGNCPVPPIGAATITVTIGAPPVGVGSISTATATLPLPACAPGGSLLAAVVPVPVPAGTAGILPVVGTATINFNDGTTFIAAGDTFVSFVEEAAGQPGVPRLSVELVSPAPANPFLRAAGGSQVEAVYKVTNHDPSESVSVTLTARSRQNARLPTGNTQGTAFSLAAPFTGDDFPHAFDAPACSIVLPLNPSSFIAPDITKPLTLGPGQSKLVTVDIRSYPKCGTGSCTENSLVAQGSFTGGDTAEACAATAYVVDNSLPSTCCAPRELVAPSCALEFLPPPPSATTRVEATVRDTGSGLARVLVLEDENAVVTIPPFAAGTTSPVKVTADKIDPTRTSRIQIRIDDRCGSSRVCDPVVTAVVRVPGQPAAATFDRLLQEEDTITVRNGHPGLRGLDAWVNGVRFQLFKLTNGEVRDLDISSALLPGGDNVVTLRGRGRAGSAATVLIWDGGE